MVLWTKKENRKVSGVENYCQPVFGLLTKEEELR